MYETEPELRELQTLIDASLGRSTAHLQSIITGERSLSAEQMTRVLTGMCVLVLSTVTAKGEPRVSAVDGHFLHGRWVFGTARSAAKARHLRVRPAASAAHLRGEELGVFVHGAVEELTPVNGQPHPDWPPIHEYLRGFYGDMSFDFDVVYYRLRPTWMTVYATDPAGLLAQAS
ncbi:pyridoxamine 5'-phosphate oxidase family protein [Pseudonocardia sp. DSM 110487]|uniref:pyridoxamine 5'-phosphate oxidase family protein n=1 Tax=Pseudonocardia sp. DSM 110487 TaxID=2865833 RepID=UPI001C69E986|nr:pyridoxamine 5'-phosphate oxidase family protein [Pseudonocardia sp. DSM 110487]QYN34214.1 pyridoxamine 5'-phosphate oxidase family protein [Pseudonocardia sp. DSM 110487]